MSSQTKNQYSVPVLQHTAFTFEILLGLLALIAKTNLSSLFGLLNLFKCKSYLPWNTPSGRRK